MYDITGWGINTIPLTFLKLSGYHICSSRRSKWQTSPGKHFHLNPCQCDCPLHSSSQKYKSSFHYSPLQNIVNARINILTSSNNLYKLSDLSWNEKYDKTPSVPKYKTTFPNLGRLRKLVRLVIYTWYYQFIPTTYLYPHSPCLPIYTWCCRVTLGKNSEKLKSDFIIKNKLNFKSDIIFRNREREYLEKIKSASFWPHQTKFI